MLISYLVAFLVAFAISSVVAVFVARYFTKREPTRIQDVHRHPVTRFGGVAVLGAFVVALLLHSDLIITKDIFALILGMAIVAIGGFADDRKDKSVFMQVSVQLAGVLLFLVVGGISIATINNPFGEIWHLGSILGAVVAGFWMLVVMNTINWLDGLDGLGSTILLIGFIVLAIVGALPNINQPPLVIVSLAAAGAIGALLVFNVPPALIFLGTGGVLGVSFLLGGISVMAGGKVATASIVLGIPIIDAIWVLWQRFTAHVPLTGGDTRHLHHTLLRAGLSPRYILLIYAVTTSLFAFVALTLTGPWRLLGGAVVLVIFYIVARRFYSFRVSENID